MYKADLVDLSVKSPSDQPLIRLLVNNLSLHIFVILVKTYISMLCS